MMAFGASAVFADEGFFKASIGLKGWYNWWTHTIDYADGTSHTWNNGSAFMLGPSFNIKVGGAFFSGTYLQSLSNYEARDWFTTNDSMEFERRDADLTLGYMFIPYFGAFIGYKDIDAPMTYKNASGVHLSAYDGHWKLKGPGIGILGNVPLGQSAALYANLAYMKVSQKYSDSIGTYSDFDMTGATFELGGAFAMSRHVSTNIGFKYQQFSGDDSAGDTQYQKFYGLTAGVNYTF